MRTRTTIELGLLRLYALLLPIMWADVESGSFFSRLIPSDVILIALIAFAVPRRYFYCGTPAIFAILLCLALGIPFLLRPDGAPLQVWAIHLFSVVGFIVMASTLLDATTEQRVKFTCYWIYVSAFWALVGIYEFLAVTVGGPRLLGFITTPGLDVGVVGTFRSTGQAGTYFGTVALLAAALMPTIGPASRWGRILYIISLGLLTLATLGTLKRASIIAMALGFALMIILNSGRKKISLAVLATGLAGAVYLCVPMLSNQGNERIQQRIETKTDISSVGSFWEENIASALRAFAERPLFGWGLGRVRDERGYEIHSTYFGVLAYGGLTAVALYAIFMFALIRRTSMPLVSLASTKQAGLRAIALWVGLIASFGYTYHLRKREFWLLSAILIAMSSSRALADLIERSRKAGHARHLTS